MSDNGGPAFPANISITHSEIDMGGGCIQPNPDCVGLTWLDYAAIQIAASVMSNKNFNPDKTEHLTAAAYNVAELLLAEKRRRENGG